LFFFFGIHGVSANKTGGRSKHCNSFYSFFFNFVYFSLKVCCQCWCGKSIMIPK